MGLEQRVTELEVKMVAVEKRLSALEAQVANDEEKLATIEPHADHLGATHPTKMSPVRRDEHNPA